MRRFAPMGGVERRPKRQRRAADDRKQPNGHQDECNQYFNDAEPGPATGRQGEAEGGAQEEPVYRIGSTFHHRKSARRSKKRLMACGAPVTKASLSQARYQNGPPDSVRGAVAVAAAYLQTGSPSPAVDTKGFVVFTPIAQLKLAICVCEIVADQ